MKNYEIRSDGDWLFGIWDNVHSWWYEKDLLREEALKKLKKLKRIENK